MEEGGGGEGHPVHSPTPHPPPSLGERFEEGVGVGGLIKEGGNRGGAGRV